MHNRDADVSRGGGRAEAGECGALSANGAAKAVTSSTDWAGGVALTWVRSAASQWCPAQLPTIAAARAVCPVSCADADGPSAWVVWSASRYTGDAMAWLAPLVITAAGIGIETAAVRLCIAGTARTSTKATTASPIRTQLSTPAWARSQLSGQPWTMSPPRGRGQPVGAHRHGRQPAGCHPHGRARGRARRHRGYRGRARSSRRVRRPSSRASAGRQW